MGWTQSVQVEPARFDVPREGAIADVAQARSRGHCSGRQMSDRECRTASRRVAGDRPKARSPPPRAGVSGGCVEELAPVLAAVVARDVRVALPDAFDAGWHRRQWGGKK
jgi:hypothetical protein